MCLEVIWRDGTGGGSRGPTEPRGRARGWRNGGDRHSRRPGTEGPARRAAGDEGGRRERRCGLRDLRHGGLPVGAGVPAGGRGGRRAARSRGPGRATGRWTTPGLLDGRVAKDQVDGSYQDGQQHERESSLEILGEGDLVAVLLGDVRKHHVGAGADDGAVAPQACA